MRHFVVLIMLFVSAVACAGAPPIQNFHTFGDGLYRGARPDNNGLAALQKMGVKTIVNLQGGDLNNPAYRWIIPTMEPGELPEAIEAEKTTTQNLGMNFVNVPLDSLSTVTHQEGQQIGALIRMMSQPQNQPVFVHCEHGADRTGLVVALYRVYFQGWNAQAAHDEMESMGHDTLHSVFTHELDEFYWEATKGH